MTRGISSVELEWSPLETPPSDGEGQQVQERQKRMDPFVTDGGAIAQFRPSSFQNQPPRYPWAARLQGWEGTVVVRGFVTPNGMVSSLRIVKSTGYAVLDEAALKALGRWQFIPSRRKGKAVASLVEIPITFRLDEKK